MSASPQGLLSDRNMADRLRLGHMSEEDHCLQRRRYLPSRSDLEHRKLFIVSFVVLTLTSEP